MFLSISSTLRADIDARLNLRLYTNTSHKLQIHTTHVFSPQARRAIVPAGTTFRTLRTWTDESGVESRAAHGHRARGSHLQRDVPNFRTVERENGWWITH
ncbi:hypothetical protein BC827DRAFT_1218872, partial [Russula dissimulans]